MDIKEIIRQVGEDIQKGAGVKAVFGEPVVKEGVTIIPVARIVIRGGGGGGRGPGEDEIRPRGVGLALRVKSEAAGYIEVTEHGATYVEIRDNSKLALAGMALAALGLYSFSRVLVRYFKSL